MSITPRDYRQPGRVLKQDLSTLLDVSPEAFDCLVFRALPSEDEQVTIEQDVVGSIESGERAQSYAEPVEARARIVPDEGLAFGVLSSALAENFIGASQPMNILLSVPGVRKYSLVQWMEFPDVDSDGAELRTVYVLDSKPVGRTLGAGVIYTCLPLPALGEVPQRAPTDNDEGGDAAGETVPPGSDDVVGVL